MSLKYGLKMPVRTSIKFSESLFRRSKKSHTQCLILYFFATLCIILALIKNGVINIVIACLAGNYECLCVVGYKWINGNKKTHYLLERQSRPYCQVVPHWAYVQTEREQYRSDNRISLTYRSGWREWSLIRWIRGHWHIGGIGGHHWKGDKG